MSPCSDKTERRFHLGQTARDEAEKCVGNGQKSSDDGSVDIDVELPYKIHRSNLAELTCINKPKTIRLLLGATAMSTKVSYKIVFPYSYSEFPIENFRPGRFLFRSMITNEHIVEINREKLPPTNLFVFVEMREANVKKSADCKFLPAALGPRGPGRRTKNVNINIKPKVISDHVRNGNLFTPSCPKIASRPFGEDILYPASMEMCTPVTTHNTFTNNVNGIPSNLNGKRQRKYSDSRNSAEIKRGVRKRHFSIEMCTPRRGLDRMSMELCTPICGVARGRGSMEMCTPSYGVSSVRRGRGSMEMCTPLHSYRNVSSQPNGISRNGSSDYLAQAADNQSNDFASLEENQPTALSDGCSLEPCTSEDIVIMEMCTPMPLPKRASTISTCSAAMEMCTPAAFSPPPSHMYHPPPTPPPTYSSYYSSTARLRHSSSMEMCTPHVARKVMEPLSPPRINDCQNRLTDLALNTPPSKVWHLNGKSKGVENLESSNDSAAIWYRWPVGIKGIPLR